MGFAMTALRRRWQAWWQSRLPLADTHVLTQRNVYIVPTPVGLAFCATLGVLLLASINEQLSLGYALTFALTGAGLASMHTTHANLRGLQLDLKPPEGVHAGDDYPLELRLHNPGAARHGLALQARLSDGRLSEPAWVDVPARGHAQLTLRLPAEQRGLRALPTLQLSTRFPLGLFRAWSYWRPASTVWVYPRAEQPPPPFPTQPEAGDAATSGSAPAQAGGSDFAGVRAYRRGDTLRAVLWRKSVSALEAGLPPWVRDTEAPPAHELWLLWEASAGRDIEARLARLTAWVLAADRAGRPYGLRLPGQALAPALGLQHKLACLQALARHG